MTNNYKSALQSNNTDLQAILDTINELSEATEQVTPTISVNSSNGLITATAGAKSSTYQLAFQTAKTITPNTTSQIAINSGHYTAGSITVVGDPNLVAGNIKSGVSIFGVSGNYNGSGGGDGNTDMEDALVAGTVSTYFNDTMTIIGSYAFAGCFNLTSINLPAATTIGSYAFVSCSNLTSVNLPAATTINSNAFAGCSNLTSINLPAVTTIGSAAFASSDLITASFPKAIRIERNAFFYCNIRYLYLLGSSVCQLVSSAAFQGSPIGGFLSNGSESIYVPASLLTSYKTATNWTYFSSLFVGV